MTHKDLFLTLTTKNSIKLVNTATLNPLEGRWSLKASGVVSKINCYQQELDDYCVCLTFLFLTSNVIIFHL